MCFEWGIFASNNPKNQLLCLFIVCRVATNGANPARFTQPNPKRKRKAAPRMHPGIGKRHRKRKRNKELA